MISRPIVEKILAANGIEATAEDEVIKSVLIEANWHQDDVDTALTVLRENTTTHVEKVDSLHKVFRTDERLKPETISALLGIDVDVKNYEELRLDRSTHQSFFSQVASIALVSIGLALIFVMGGMWFWQIGIFHHSY